ncbi:type VII secretion protein EccE [Mycobacterium kyorinense]|uniref:Type VII secretion protein EccE n=1 Tax=Mycobacterium kyorinense TaxID=487514 RepID=A0A1X1Y126_9MYCO|nr:type VII secretion protein EccE [Mycobacterium kyorinense]ORW04807.1 type VII secretion protein EccE [Mycobacterium kyorinense]
MKAQRKFGLALSWPRITTVFLIDVAVLAIASHCPDAWQAHHIAWWSGVGVAAVVAIVALVTFRGIPLASAPVARVRNWYADPEALVAGCTPAIDHQRRFGREVVGIREYGARLVTVIAVEGPADVAPGRHRQRHASSGVLPVEAVATALRQFDVRLDGVDIVSVGTRSGSTGVESAVQDDFGAADDGRGRPLDERRTWLVVRMDPQHNVAAVAARDSVASTLAAATERLAQELNGRRCVARTLSAAEIADVDDAVLAGLDPSQIRPYWRYLRHLDGYVTSFWVSPSDINGETFDELWLADTDATVVTVRLLPHRHGIDVSALVRYHSDKRLRKKLWGGLNRLTGRQLAAVRASLPAPLPGPPLALPSRALADDELLAVPIDAAAPVPPEYSASTAGAPR